MAIRWAISVKSLYRFHIEIPAKKHRLLEQDFNYFSNEAVTSKVFLGEECRTIKNSNCLCVLCIIAFNCISSLYQLDPQLGDLADLYIH